MTIASYLKQIDEVNEGGKYKDNWESLANYPIPDWYQKGRFGLFIHWGVYSVPEYFSEWYSRLMYQNGHPCNIHHKMKYGSLDKFSYKDFIPQFTAPKFNADEWLDVFAKSGAKYIMPVGEHHDGFKMYNSDLNIWNSVQMGPKRDILGELKESCDKHNIGFCTSSHRAEHYWFMGMGRRHNCDVNDDKYRDFYGPAMDINSAPGADQPTKEWLEDWLASTAEMIDKYQPQALYFDWWVREKSFRPYMKKFVAYYYNRALEWGKQVCIFYKWDCIMYGSGIFDVERGQLSGISPRLWQNDTAIAKNSWGYTQGNKFKTPFEIISNMVDVISKNGCYMLNVGPKADGQICQEEKAVLLEIGKWMDINGEGIYDAQPYKIYGEGKQGSHGSFKENIKYSPKDIRFTYKPGIIYAYVLKESKKGNYLIKSLGKSDDKISFIIDKIELLGSKQTINYKHTAKGLQINISENLGTENPICFKIHID